MASGLNVLQRDRGRLPNKGIGLVLCTRAVQLSSHGTPRLPQLTVSVERTPVSAKRRTRPEKNEASVVVKKGNLLVSTGVRWEKGVVNAD